MVFKKNEEKYQKFETLYPQWKPKQSELRQSGLTSFEKFCEYIGVTPPCGYNWKHEIEKEHGAEEPAFDLQAYLRGELEEIAKSLVSIIKSKKSTKSIELALKTLGELVEKREDKVKFEFTIADKQRLFAEWFEQLREQQRDGGLCALCGEYKTLRIQTCVDSEPEHETDREVEALELSA